MRSGAFGVIACLSLLETAGSAQYTIILKNSREVSVEDYREDGPWIRATVFGGEVSFPKESLSRIEKTTGIAPAAPTNAISFSPQRETAQEVTELDREIQRAQEEFLEAQRRGAGADEIRQKQLSWNRLRLERFRLLRKLSDREESPPAKK